MIYAVVNNLSTFIFSIIRAIGLIMLGFGIVQFGSYASGKATEKSDLDFLVEFKTRHIDLFTLSGLRIDLEESFSIPVDVVHAPISEDSLLEIEEVIPIYEQA